jgi:NADH dehydrogenase
MRRDKNVTVELAEVTDFDLDKHIVHATLPLGERIEVPYDSLIVATGVTQSYFGHDEFAEFAPGMKTIDDAMELRRRIFGAFEMAETARDAEEQRLWLTVVIVGSGPTGVELAGQVRELATRSLRREFRTFDPTTVRVVLLDAGDQPLATFGDHLAERAAKTLEKTGVELRMHAKVVGVDAFGVDIENADGAKERIDAHTVVWAAGVQATPLAAKLAAAAGVETDRAGRIKVEPDLTLPGHPDVFAVGDMTSLNSLPGVAEVAMQGGLHAANTIRRRVLGDDKSIPFEYRDLGSVAAIARFKAIFSWKRVHLSGFPAWMIWLFVHLAFLNGFANRFTTVIQWSRSMIGRARQERVISVAAVGGDRSGTGSSIYGSE